jgi:hypothetical protein
MARPLIEDTARNNLASWTAERVAAGAARGAVINPFCTGPVASQSKPAAQRIAEQIRAAGGEVWFDSMTHVLSMPNTGDFRYYEQWGLWDGTAGTLTTRAQRRDHIQRVFDLQSRLGAPHLAPTVLAHSSTGAELVAVMSLLEDALEVDPDCWASISGTPSFWSGGPNLDALVGTLAQMSPAGWFLSVARADDTLPVRPSPSEIAGMCRTVRSLSEFTSVHVSHGDLAGMPAVAAGAESVSTGWDARQRVLHYASFTERLPATGGGGGWFQRPTFQGLLASLPRAPAELMFQQNGRIAQGLFAGQLHPTGPKEAFNHHLDVVGTLTDRLSSTSYEDRYQALRTSYEMAKADWPIAATAAQREDESDVWIDPFLAGLMEYGSTEGW